MAIVKFINNKVSLKNTLEYIMKKEKTIDKLISGKDCIAENAFDEMMVVKRQFKKTDGREKIHFIQAFSPKDDLNYEKAHEIGLKMAEHFKGFQVVVATHKDTQHIHNHILINTVNFENGRKFHQSRQDLATIKELSNKLCIENNLTISKDKSSIDDIKIDEYKSREKGESWKLRLEEDIIKCMKKVNSKKEFFGEMNKLGYQVTWTKERKNITFITPDGRKCRDRKLHNERFLKDNMELYFKRKFILNEARLNMENKSKIYKNNSISFNFIQLFKNRNIKQEEESYKLNNDYGINAKKEWARKMSYSNEEMEM